MHHHDYFWQLSTLSDKELEGRLQSLVSSERSTTARLVAHLAEVLDRQLHLEQAYPSMTAYCRQKLHLKEDDAGRRIAAARLGARYPAIFPMLDSGELTLSVACKLKHYINEENHADLLEGLRGLCYREAEAWLATKFPRVDVPSRVRKLPSTTSAPQESTSAPDRGPATTPVATSATAPVAAPATAPVAASAIAAAAGAAFPLQLSGSIDPLPPRPRDRGRVEALSPARYRIEFTAGEELCALHNRLDAERIYGRGHIARAIAERRSKKRKPSSAARACDEDTVWP